MNPPHFVRSGRDAGPLPPAVARAAEALGHHAAPRPPAGMLLVRGYGDSSTGYGRMTGHLVRELTASGVPCLFAPILLDESRRPLEPALKSRLWLGGSDVPCVQMSAVPSDLPTGSAILSMWESTRLPEDTVPHFNRARVVIVPCRANAEWFRESGVTAPVRVVPLGIDPAIYRPGEPPPAGTFVVMANARMAHGGERKGVAEVVEAFVEALGDREDAELRLKLWPDCTLPDPDHPRIRVDRSGYDDAGLAGLYRSASAFMTLSKGEGWGLTPLEAMACGRPVIGPIHSGMADFLTPECGYPVESDRVPAGGFYEGCGDWFVPRHASAVAQLRAAYADAEGRRRKGEAAARRAAEFPWSRSAAGLLAVLREFGLAARAKAPAHAPAPAPAPARRLDPAARDRVNACPDRGPEGGLVLLEEERSCCGGGEERTLCRAGRGRRPGRVTLRECLACAAG